MTSTGISRLQVPAQARLACLLAAVCCLPLSSLAQDRDLAEERSHVLRVLGFVQPLNANLFPAENSTGVIARQPVAIPQAESLRLHFELLGTATAGDDWEVRLTKDGAPRWRFSGGDLLAGGIWSDEIEGDRVTVELVSRIADNPVRLRIDLVAATRRQLTPESFTGENQLSPIAAHDSWVQAIGRSVARLRFIGDDRRIYTCTAFLITRELMLTNQHCIASESELHSALVDFDFDSDIAETTFVRLREMLSADHDLDYTVVRLARSFADRKPLAISSSAITADQALLIIQHPGGEPKQVSVEDCRADSLLIAGRGSAETDFTHLCDTLGGSSGSPIIAVETRQVVGLHHLGFEDDDDVLFNRGVHIDKVRSHFPPEIRAQLDTMTPP